MRKKLRKMGVAIIGEVPWGTHFCQLIEMSGHKQAKEALENALKQTRRTKESLRRAHDELEQRVEERTAELKKTNEQLKIAP